MKYCKGYIGVTCINGNCPNAQEDQRQITCEECFYFRGCEDCAAPCYGCCPEGKTGDEET